MTAPPPIPETLRALMAEIGPRWAEDKGGNVRRMIDAFTELLKSAPKEGIEVTRDIAYGDHPRQRFDLFLPPRAKRTGASLLFVHGGAFIEGHRNRTDEIYSNVLYYFARHGVVGVNVGYRLADDTPYPGASEDVGAAVAWMRGHAAEFGADPARLFLMGHSAGAAHAGSYAYDKRLQPPGGPGIAGMIVVSGRVRADNLPENPNAKRVETYYGPDAARYDDLSPVTHVGPGSVPTFVAMGEYENPLLDVYCLELAYRLAAAKRRAPPVMWLKGHNHTSMIGHFNTAEDHLGRAILEFIERPT
jgi:acetyl esterase/lipase